MLSLIKDIGAGLSILGFVFITGMTTFIIVTSIIFLYSLQVIYTFIKKIMKFK